MLAGGRSSEHDVSLASGESVREGLAAAGHEVLRVLLERDGRWMHDGKSWTCAPPPASSAPTSSSRCCTGPSARTAPSRGCSSSSTCAYVGSGVLASALCMDKIALQGRHGGGRAAAGPLRRAWRRPPSARTAPRRSRRSLARAARVRQAGAARLVGRHREGRRGPGSRGGARARLRPRSARHRRGPQPRPGGRVLGARPHRDGRGEHARADRPARRRLVRLRGEVPAGRHGAARAGGDLRRGAARASGGSRRRRSASSGCSGLARVDFFVEGDDVLLNEVNTMPGFTATSVYAKLWDASGLPYPQLVDRLCALARRAP